MNSTFNSDVHAENPNSGTIRDVSKDRPQRWTDYPIGMTLDEIKSAGLDVKRKEWDMEGSDFLGKTLLQVAPVLLQESRFNLQRFTPPPWIGDYQGHIWKANFTVYEANPHEQPGQIRRTGTGGSNYWLPVEVMPNGELRVEDSTIEDPLTAGRGFSVAMSSLVLLNNLSNPGSFGGFAHFPMLDIVHPPTPNNVNRLITDVKERCGVEKFFVLRSSDHGMMVLGPELIDENNFVAFLFNSLLLNHMEVSGEYWVDDRWVARSAQNLTAVSGNAINPWRFSGMLRGTTALPTKTEEPTIIASSF